MEQHLLTVTLFRIALVVLAGAVLWRVFRALERKLRIRRDFRMAILGVGALLSSALVVGCVVQYAAALAFLQKNQREGNGRFQAATAKELPSNGLNLSNEDWHRLQELCALDHVLEFRIKGTSFYLPWRSIREQWTQASAVWVSTGGASCPKGPVPTEELFFYPFARDVARARDLNLFWVRVGARERLKNFLHVDPSNLASRVAGENGIYWEDVTDAWRGQHPNPDHVASDFRAYRFQASAAEGGSAPAPLQITCGDLDPKIGARNCRAVSFEYEGLFVEYQLYARSSHAFSSPADFPDAPIEPVGLPAFDARIRKWLTEIQRKPGS